MKTILLADDEANLRALVRTTLEDPDRRIVEVRNGVDALAAIQSERPDLVLLDWMMPGLTGFDVLRAIRADPATALVPVIMLTGRGHEHDRSQALAVGATAYLAKPFSPLELLEKVANVLSASISNETAECPMLTAELEGKLRHADTQIALYARDLKRSVDAERARAGELADANEKLAALSRLKTDFLSFVAHHLRTPLTALSVFDLIDSTEDAKEQAEVIAIVRSGFDQMHGLIQRSLDYFEWLGAAHVADSKLTDLGAVIRSVAERCVARDQDASIRIVCPEQPCLALGDDRHFAEVVGVILDNACKFSPSGKRIEVKLARHDDRFSLTVRDQGMGVTREVAAHLFEPFTIADVENLASGKGLNLAIARAIVEAHGGTIRLDSDGLGHGATVCIEIPAAPVPAATRF